MDGSWIGHRRDLFERRQRIGRINAGSESPVPTHAIDVVGEVERFSQRLHPQPLPELERAADACAQAEEVEAGSRVAIDEYTIDGRARGRALNGVGASGDVERQGRVILQEAGQLKAVAEPFPGGVRGAHRRMNRAVENEAMALVIVGAAVILPDVEVVNGRAEEEFAHVVERLRIRVRDPIAPPANGPLDERNVESIVVRIGQRRVLAVVAVGEIRAASVVGAGSRATGDVLVHRDDQVQAADVLVADAQRAVAAELLLDLEAALLRISVLHVRIHGGKVEQDAGRQSEAGKDVREYRRARPGWAKG